MPVSIGVKWKARKGLIRRGAPKLLLRIEQLFCRNKTAPFAN
jgi:hypothetical protein